MLSRFYYHSLVAIWLVLLCIIDVVANSLLEGIESDLYFYKVFFDALLIGWTYLFIKEDLSGNVVSASSTTARRANVMPSDPLSDRGRAEVVHVDLGKSEYIYYGFLALYGIGNFFFHHASNKNSTGMLSIGTLIISIADMVIAAVAIYNFWQVASGKLVRLQQTVNQRLER